jgi:hypothetical protein
MASSFRASAKNGYLWKGSHLLIKRQPRAIQKHGPSVLVKSGDKVVFTASHGMGHLINSLYQEDEPV